MTCRPSPRRAPPVGTLARLAAANQSRRLTFDPSHADRRRRRAAVAGPRAGARCGGAPGGVRRREPLSPCASTSNVGVRRDSTRSRSTPGPTRARATTSRSSSPQPMTLVWHDDREPPGRLRPTRPPSAEVNARLTSMTATTLTWTDARAAHIDRTRSHVESQLASLDHDAPRTGRSCSRTRSPTQPTTTSAACASPSSDRSRRTSSARRKRLEASIAAQRHHHHAAVLRHRRGRRWLRPSSFEESAAEAPAIRRGRTTRTASRRAFSAFSPSCIPTTPTSSTSCSRTPRMPRATVVEFELSDDASDGQPRRRRDRSRSRTSSRSPASASRPRRTTRPRSASSASASRPSSPTPLAQRSARASTHSRSTISSSQSCIDGAAPAGLTTFSFPFDRAEKPADAARAEVERGLRELDEKTLLFLNNIREITYELPDGDIGFVKRTDVDDVTIKVEVSQGDGLR